MSEIEELKKKISYLENENIVMYAALLEASNLSGVAALRCKVELQRIARGDNAQQSMHPTGGSMPDLQAVSTSQHLVTSQALSTPPTCG